METAKDFLSIVGAVESAFLVVVIASGIVMWVKGIGPPLWRLGHGLARRKIAIFATSANLASLKSLLLDSRLFSEKNIIEVQKPEDIGAAEGASVYLMFWPDFADVVDEVLLAKRNAVPLIVYAPQDYGFIPKDELKKLDSKRHTAVTNFRGRLLNDIVTSLITTSYEKR